MSVSELRNVLQRRFTTLFVCLPFTLSLEVSLALMEENSHLRSFMPTEGSTLCFVNFASRKKSTPQTRPESSTSDATSSRTALSKGERPSPEAAFFERRRSQGSGCFPKCAERESATNAFFPETPKRLCRVWSKASMKFLKTHRQTAVQPLSSGSLLAREEETTNGLCLRSTLQVHHPHRDALHSL